VEMEKRIAAALAPGARIAAPCRVEDLVGARSLEEEWRRRRVGLGRCIAVGHTAVEVVVGREWLGIVGEGIEGVERIAAEEHWGLRLQLVVERQVERRERRRLVVLL